MTGAGPPPHLSVTGTQDGPSSGRGEPSPRRGTRLGTAEVAMLQAVRSVLYVSYVGPNREKKLPSRYVHACWVRLAL
ncbi:Hypp1620 [Branchiostoma lanceolatum]|uniref:Hypp1620 protein n=1 Tax=Branchiostoma lanceolatum TaxID=7740 RepID=A0A8J9ZJ91_BRALA|nr:Hypp1620 [Branchiostoma lanceolatum]